MAFCAESFIPCIINFKLDIFSSSFPSARPSARCLQALFFESIDKKADRNYTGIS